MMFTAALNTFWELNKEVKVSNVRPITCHKDARWGVGQRHAPAALLPGNRHCNHRIGDWVGPRAGLDGCGKSRHYRDSNLQTVQPVASRYTDYVIPAHTKKYDKLILQMIRRVI